MTAGLLRMRGRGLAAAVAALTVVAAGVACIPAFESEPDPLERGLLEAEPPPWLEGELPESESTVEFSLPEGWELVEGETGPTEPGGHLEQEWQWLAADGETADDVVLTVDVEHRPGLADDPDWQGRGPFDWRSTGFHGLDSFVGYAAADRTRYAVRLGNWRMNFGLTAPEDVDGSEFLEAAALHVEFDPTVPADEAVLNVLDSDTDLALVCEGEHFANGAPYEGDAPHPTQMFMRDENGDWGEPEAVEVSLAEQIVREEAAAVAGRELEDGELEARERLPDALADWGPDEADPGDIQLVACVETDEREVTSTGTTCTYTASIPYEDVDVGEQFTTTLETVTDPITLYEVATGAVVADATAQSAETCPWLTHSGGDFEEAPTISRTIPLAEDYLASFESHIFD